MHLKENMICITRNVQLNQIETTVYLTSNIRLCESGLQKMEIHKLIHVGSAM